MPPGIFELEDDELEALLAEMEDALGAAAAAEQADALAAAEDADLAALVQDFQATALGSPRVPCPGAPASPFIGVFMARSGCNLGCVLRSSGCDSMSSLDYRFESRVEDAGCRPKQGLR